MKLFTTVTFAELPLLPMELMPINVSVDPDVLEEQRGDKPAHDAAHDAQDDHHQQARS